MKKVIKKIVTIAAVFTLIGSGAGTAIIKNNAPELNNTLVASAASPVRTMTTYNSRTGEVRVYKYYESDKSWHLVSVTYISADPTMW